MKWKVFLVLLTLMDIINRLSRLTGRKCAMGLVIHLQVNTIFTNVNNIHWKKMKEK